MGHVPLWTEERKLPFVSSPAAATPPDTAVCLLSALQDVPGICAEFRPQGVHVLVDGTQTLGMVPIDVAKVGMSVLAFGCHKGLNTPTGLGVLYLEPSLIEQTVPPTVGLQSIANLPPSLIASTDPIEWVKNATKFEAGNLNYMAIRTSSSSTLALPPSGSLACGRNPLFTSSAY